MVTRVLLLTEAGLNSGVMALPLIKVLLALAFVAPDRHLQQLLYELRGA